MCAYKLCKVEFRYWGMQSKIERFIHDTGERARPLRLCARLPALSLCICLSYSGQATPRAHMQPPTWFTLTI